MKSETGTWDPIQYEEFLEDSGNGWHALRLDKIAILAADWLHADQTADLSDSEVRRILETARSQEVPPVLFHYATREATDRYLTNGKIGFLDYNEAGCNPSITLYSPGLIPQCAEQGDFGLPGSKQTRLVNTSKAGACYRISTFATPGIRRLHGNTSAMENANVQSVAEAFIDNAILEACGRVFACSCPIPIANWLCIEQYNGEAWVPDYERVA